MATPPGAPSSPRCDEKPPGAWADESGSASDPELLMHQEFLRRGFEDAVSPRRKTNTKNEAVLMSPLFSRTAHSVIAATKAIDNQHIAVLGCEATSSRKDGSNLSEAKPDPIYLNTSTPSSAFICGLQGSGKSHTLACMLECCLLDNPLLEPRSKPLTGLVFHYDTQIGDACEAAGICSGGVRTKVLVSPSNFRKMAHIYGKVEGAKEHLEVIPLRFQSHHLNVERITKLMAFSKDNPPLYQLTLLKIIREMALDAQKPKKRYTGDSFDYRLFKQKVSASEFTAAQKGPLDLRFEILESFLDLNPTSQTDILAGEQGCLTIVDLSDPVVDDDTACVLFNICLSIFLEKTPGSIGKYMKEGSDASAGFTNSLMSTIRLQRHNGCRIIIATQEPTIAPALLSLCDMSFVHRFKSPAWFHTIRDNIAALSEVQGRLESLDVDDSTQRQKAVVPVDENAMLHTIVNLGVGECLLFASEARLHVNGNGELRKLGTGFVRFKTRMRLTGDCGRSKFAVLTARGK